MTRRPLTVDGDLTLDGPGGRLAVEARGATLTVRASSVRACLSILRFPAAHGSRREGVRRVARALGDGGLATELWLGRRRVVAVGHGVRPSWLAGLAGLPATALGWRCLGLLLLAAAMPARATTS